MGKLYEDIVSRNATYRDENDKILSAYDKMLMNEAIDRIDIQLNEAKWLDIARKVVKDKQFVYVHPKTLKIVEDKKKGYVVLDMTTANMLVTIADALKKETREKFTSMPLSQAVDIGWKLISK
jgi:uncharacterized membrane protein